MCDSTAWDSTVLDIQVCVTEYCIGNVCLGQHSSVSQNTVLDRTKFQITASNMHICVAGQGQHTFHINIVEPLAWCGPAIQHKGQIALGKVGLVSCHCR